MKFSKLKPGDAFSFQDAPERIYFKRNDEEVVSRAYMSVIRLAFPVDDFDVVPLAVEFKPKNTIMADLKIGDVFKFVGSNYLFIKIGDGKFAGVGSSGDGFNPNWYDPDTEVIKQKLTFEDVT